MKTISLWQPFATLIAVGAKRVETRGWPTPYRGRIAIHAAKMWSQQLNDIACAHPFFAPLFAAGFRGGRAKECGLPFGAIVATCRLVDCVSSIEILSSREMSAEELAFGDYTHGRYAWRLDDIVKLPEPIPYRGAQGWFEVPDNLFAETDLK